MKRRLSILSALLMLMFFNSCIDYSSELESLAYKPTIVIEGLVLDISGKSFVKVNMSSPNGDSIYNYPVNNAIVEIVEDEINHVSFKLSAPGIYSDSLFCAKTNSIYTLRINYDGKEYLATSKLMPVSKIDSLVYTPIDSISPEIKEYEVFIFANRVSPDYTSYYKIKLFKNDSIYNSYSDLLLIDDLLFNSFRNIALPYTYLSHDTMRIEIYSLTHVVYSYYSELSELTNGNINSIYSYPQNPESNISNGALGIFQASSVSSNEIILP